MSHSLGLNSLLVFRDAGPKCPVDNQNLDELQVIIVGVRYQYKIICTQLFCCFKQPDWFTVME